MHIILTHRFHSATHLLLVSNIVNPLLLRSHANILIGHLLVRHVGHWALLIHVISKLIILIIVIVIIIVI